jgi:hypothetical protein
MEKHRRQCRRNDCPIKYASRRSVIIQKKIVEITKTKLKKFTIQQKILLEITHKIYQLGIGMFPRNTQLRIGFGLFLCEKLEMLEHALR